MTGKIDNESTFRLEIKQKINKSVQVIENKMHL